jgi:hypothetical protein
MPFSFPASPTVGATSTQNGREYRYAGSNTWELVAASGGGGSGSVTIPASDPNYASTLLLARFDGTAEDSGPLALSPTISGSAAISTTQRKFGESSAYFPNGDGATTHCIKYGSGSQFDIWKTDCTVEAWVFATAIINYSGIITRDNQTDRRNWQLLLGVDGVKPIAFGLFNTSSTSFISLVDSDAFPLNQWVHVAVVRDSGVFRLYKNGVQVASASASSGTGTISTASGPVTIGALNENGNYGFSGYIDEARVLTTCIYKNGTTFTPPRSAVPAYVAPQTLTVTGSSGGGGTDSRWDLFLPPAPTSVTAAVGSGQLVVSWTAPTVLSQTPITDYTVQYSSNSGSTWTTFTRSASTATSATVNGLTNGTAYVFRVRAINGVGSGSYSATSSAATPLASIAPNAVSGLLMWLDASDASTLYDATSGGSLVSANGGIARWEDKSGNARHALQSSSSQRPLRKSGIIGGKDVVRFDGSNDILNLNNAVRWWPTGTLIAVLGNVTAATGPYWYAAQTQSPGDNPEIRFYPTTGDGLM